LSADAVLTIALAAIGAFGLAAATQASTGFGFALVAVPLITALTDPVTAVVATTIVSAGLSAYGTVRERRSVELVSAKRLIVSGLVGAPVGALAIHYLDTNALRVLIGIVLTGAVVLRVIGMEVANTPRTEIAGGIVGGALLTSTGMSGPPIVLVTYGRAIDPKTKRATLQAVFFAHDVIAIAIFVAMGLANTEIALLAAIGLFVTPGGWAAGDRLFAKLNARSFAVASNIVLGGVALVSLTQGLTAFG
jgi:uncharacterized membrane protein YfcA